MRIGKSNSTNLKKGLMVVVEVMVTSAICFLTFLIVSKYLMHIRREFNVPMNLSRVVQGGQNLVSFVRSEHPN